MSPDAALRQKDRSGGFEPTNDVEKEGTAHIWWSEIKKQPPHPMHKYALLTVYLFSFPLSPFDKMKVPI